jgi:GMP synthase-like glutamine amidotransferase
MRAHYLQHVPFEGLGCIEPWLRESGYAITSTRFYESPALPDPRDVDLLVVMGGPMSVNDTQAFPWLVQEQRFIRQCVEAGKAVLGICLGAQLIAAAMGGRVYPHGQKEIGWFPLRGVPSAVDGFFRFPPVSQVFHWHGETFDLPPGAIQLAASDACENQAFQLGHSVIGLQFHLEMTPISVREIVTHCRQELIPSAYVQPESSILSVTTDYYRDSNRLMKEVLAFLQSHQA